MKKALSAKKLILIMAAIVFLLVTFLGCGDEKRKKKKPKPPKRPPRSPRPRLVEPLCSVVVGIVSG